MLEGANELTSHLCTELNVKLGEVSKDGRFSVTEAECLGSCGTAPMMQITNQDNTAKYYENLNPESAMNILRAMK
jgi:NADH-quinone oxidoreductase subunit E